MAWIQTRKPSETGSCMTNVGCSSDKKPQTVPCDFIFSDSCISNGQCPILSSEAASFVNFTPGSEVVSCTDNNGHAVACCFSGPNSSPMKDIEWDPGAQSFKCPSDASAPRNLASETVRFNGNNGPVDIPVCQLIDGKSNGSQMDKGCWNLDDGIFKHKLKKGAKCRVDNIENIPNGVMIEKWHLDGSWGHSDCKTHNWAGHGRHLHGTYPNGSGGDPAHKKFDIGNDLCAFRFTIDPNSTAFCPVADASCSTWKALVDKGQTAFCPSMLKGGCTLPQICYS